MTKDRQRWINKRIQICMLRKKMKDKKTLIQVINRGFQKSDFESGQCSCKECQRTRELRTNGGVQKQKTQ